MIRRLLLALFSVAAFSTALMGQDQQDRRDDTVWVTQPFIRPYERAYPFFDGLFQDVSAIQVNQLLLDPNSANAYSVDALQSSFQLSAQYNMLSGIQNTAAAQYYTATASLQTQLLNQQAQLAQQLTTATQQLVKDQEAVSQAANPTAAQKAAVAQDDNTISGINAQLTAIKGMQANLPSSPGFAQTAPAAPTSPTSLAGQSQFQIPASNTPNYPATKKMDNQVNLLWDRLTRLLKVSSLPDNIGDWNLYFVDFDPAVIRTDKAATLLEMRYQLKCDDEEAKAMPLVVDLYPKEAAVNIASEKWKDHSFGLSAIFSFFSFGASAAYNREHLQASQAMAQSSYVSGYGVGMNRFGWQFGRTIGEDAIRVGEKPTAALIAVPSTCTSWSVSPTVVKWRDKHNDDTGTQTSTVQELQNATLSWKSFASDTASASRKALKGRRITELRFAIVQYDSSAPTPTIATVSLATAVRLDPQMTVNVDGYQIKRARDNFARATPNGGSSGLLESSALAVNTWIPTSSNSLILNLDASMFTTHFPRIELVAPSPEDTIDVANELRAKSPNVTVNGYTWICPDIEQDGCEVYLPPLAYLKGATKALLATRLIKDARKKDAIVLITAPDDLKSPGPSGAAAAPAGGSVPALQVISEDVANSWGAKPIAFAQIEGQSEPQAIELNCNALGSRLECSFPTNRKSGATSYDAQKDYLITALDAGHAGGAIQGTAELRHCPVPASVPCAEPLVWHVSPPVLEPNGKQWHFEMTLANVEEGQTVTLSDNSAIVPGTLSGTTECKTPGEPCNVSFTIPTNKFDSLTDAMELSVDAVLNAHKSTVLNLRSALAPVISSVDTSKQTVSGRNLVFENMRVGEQGTNISISCSTTGGECMLPKLSSNQHGYLYFVSANNQLLPWLQPTASGTTLLKDDALAAPKAAAGAAAVPASPKPAGAPAPSPKIAVIQ
jgi:hypothetical protein